MADFKYNHVTPAIVQELESIAGKEWVNANPAITQSYVTRAIMGLVAVPPEVVVRATNADQIRKILMLASKNHIPVTPAAGGASGGYACPTITPGGILLDLNNMNRILEVNEDSRYVVIESGVRSGVVWAYFRKNYPRWAPPIPDGAPPAATLMGDAIERGFSLVTSKHGPQGDLILGMEIVVPNGDIIRTGSWALKEMGDDVPVEPFYKYGVGPDLHSLFLGSQGAMGVVTKLAIQIIPHPEFKTVVAYGSKSCKDIALASLEVIKHEIGVMVQGGNLELTSTYVPHKEVSKEAIPKPWKRPTDSPYWKGIAEAVPEWFCNFEIWGHDQAHLDWQVNKVHEIMKQQKETKKYDLTEWKLHPRQIESRLKKPNKIAIPYGQYQAGFVFITWYLPWTGVPRFCEEYNEILMKHGLAPVMWFASIDNGRMAIGMPTVVYDSTNPESIKAVYDADKETTEKFIKYGWLNYRPSAELHAPITYKHLPTYMKYLHKVKEMFDPNYIMHPGRLGLPAFIDELKDYGAEIPMPWSYAEKKGGK